MPHAIDPHDANLVGNFVNHTVVAHADAPVGLGARQLAATGRARIRCQCLNRRNDACESRTRAGRGLSRRRVQAGRDTWSLAVVLGEVVLQRTVVERLRAGALEPGHVVSILHTFQQFFVVLDGDDDGDRFAFARHDFEFGQCCFHGS